MDVGYFLKQRTSFLRQFYNNACLEFVERKRKIEAEEDPFVPPYREDSEPAFLEEWLEADDSLNVLGYACISMLSAALRLYLKTLESELRCPAKGKYFKKAGSWFEGYRRYFAGEFKIIWEDSKENLSFLEEIVVARNSIQHPPAITTHRTAYSRSDISKLRHPFFVDENERKLFSDMEEAEQAWLFPPTVRITSENLYVAIDAVETFCSWLDDEIVTRVFNKSIG